MKNEVLKFIKKSIPLEVRDKVEILIPENYLHGDYSTNVAFILAKLKNKSPMKVGEEIKNKIMKNTPNFFLKIEVVEPGFINFWLSNDELLSRLNKLLSNPNKWGEGREGEGKVVVVEYFQPNIAKVLHIGHLRSAVIGDSIKRMFLFRGYKAVSDTHIGDWGTQFGILLHAYKELNKFEQKKIENDPFKYLNDLYVNENKKIDVDPQRREDGKREFAKLEKGDRQNRKIWKWMVDISMKKIYESANLLGLLQFEENMNESEYEDFMPDIVEELLKKKIATKNDDGSVSVNLEKEMIGEGFLIKSDGASTYLLRDLATIQHRKNKWKFFKNFYVVDDRQALHFKQLFEISKMAGWTDNDQNEHISIGFMSVPDGAMSTRKGTIIPLNNITDKVVSLAQEVIADKNPNLKNADNVAMQVGIGALKYFDLSHHRKSNIVFDSKRALRFEGNTGPYIQYTHSRLLSIIKKNANLAFGNKNFVLKTGVDDLERILMVEVLRFPEIVVSALESMAPNTLANYLFGLAQKTNEFYHSHPVVQEKDEKIRKFRYALVYAIAITLKRGLYLLGIEAPEEM